MFKRKLSMLLVLCMTALTLSACGTPTNDNHPKTDNSTASQTSAQASEDKEKEIKDESIGDEALYQKLFDMNNKVNIELTVPKEELDKLQEDYLSYEKKRSKSPIYRKADVKITVGDETYDIKEVGIRLKGNMSLSPVYDEYTGKPNISHYRLSFGETFDKKEYYGKDAKQWDNKDDRTARKNRKFATLEEMEVKWNSNFDDTFVREIYAAEMFRQSDVLVQHINLAALKMNGQKYGVVKIYEPIDKLFLERNIDKKDLGGDLYKVGWTYSGATYQDGVVTYGVADKDAAEKYNYNLKTNKKESAHESLDNLLETISGTPSKEDFAKVVDTDYLVKFLAASYFAGDPDDMRNNYNNHYLYFLKSSGKAIFIPYDNDRTLGITYSYNPDTTGMTAQSPFSDKAAGAHGAQQNPIINLSILNDGYYVQEYKDELKKVAALKLWDEKEFEKVYNLAKNHYENDITPDIELENVNKKFKFSLEGKFRKSDRFNMSFEDYVTRIMETYSNAIKE